MKAGLPTGNAIMNKNTQYEGYYAFFIIIALPAGDQIRM